MRGFTKAECLIWKISISVVLVIFSIVCLARIVQTEGVKIAGDAGVKEADFTSFELLTLEQQESITEEQLKAYDLTMINFWETSCPYCIQEMPALNELSKEYRGRVQFIGVCADTWRDGKINEQSIEAAKQILKIRGEAYTQTIPSEDMLEMTKQIYGYPETYFVDSDGNILKVISGAANKDQWRSIIEELLIQEGKG